MSRARGSRSSRSAIITAGSRGTRLSGVTSWARRSWGSRWASNLGGFALTPGGKTSEVLTLLTEDAVERIFTWLGWRGD